MRPIKLSKLDDGSLVFRDGDSRIYEVCELKDEILVDGEDHHEFGDWYTAKEVNWIPRAKNMIEEYIISHYESGGMYEGWDEHALDSIDKKGVKKIQKVLDEMFTSSTRYFEGDKPVEIDVFPKVVHYD